MTAIRAGSMACAGVAVIAVGVAGAASGGRGALGALLGVALATAFFSFGRAAVAYGGRRHRSLLLPVAFGVYVFEIVVLGGVLLAAQRQDTFNQTAFAWSILAAVVAWVAAEIIVALRTREPIFDPEEFRRTHVDGPR